MKPFINRMTHSIFSTFCVLFTVLFASMASAENTPTTPPATNSVPLETPLAETRNCEPSGREQFTLHIDGSLMGVFEKLTSSPAGTTDSTAVFENGVIFRGAYVQAWQASRLVTPAPAIPETHDVLVFNLSEELEVKDAFTELSESEVLELSSVPSKDIPRCLIVKTLRLKVKKVLVPSGTITP